MSAIVAPGDVCVARYWSPDCCSQSRACNTCSGLNSTGLVTEYEAQVVKGRPVSQLLSVPAGRDSGTSGIAGTDLGDVFSKSRNEELCFLFGATH